MQSNLLSFRRESVFRREYFLDLAARPVGQMKWVGLRTCEVKLLDDAFVVRRESLWSNQISVVRQEFEVSYAVSHEANFRFPLGKRNLTVVISDIPYILKSNFWRSKWHWESADGEQMIVYQTSSFSLSGAAEINRDFLPSQEALLLAALGWYMICEVREAQSAS